MNVEPPDASSAAFRFDTKANTLERLGRQVAGAKLCPQITVAVDEWRRSPQHVVDRIVGRFAPRRLAVRSSAAGEDGWDASHAGAHLSLIDVEARAPAIANAIDAVFESYRAPAAADQVLIQPMVEKTVLSGVVLTRDLDTGGPYYVVNYDDFSGRTDTVTGGAQSKTVLVHRSRPEALKSPRMAALIDAVIELERITATQHLDIEFCTTADDQVYILQVRPLAARRRWRTVPDPMIDTAIDAIRATIDANMSPRPGLAGGRTIFGEMPDWNPAEMIGNAPRPLALSLYKHLITDRVWAEARAVMGYRRVEAPLLVDFRGRPYIDVRLSFNSFLPADLDHGLAHKLVDDQLARLAERPDLHDKIEFEVAATCRHFAFADDRERIGAGVMTSGELDVFEGALGAVTAHALAQQGGGLEALARQARGLLTDAAPDKGVSSLARARALLDGCKTNGTLPFSMLARHGFIGVAFLRSLVRRGVFTPDDADRFMRSIHTVAADLVHDMHAVGAGHMDETAFLARYGHLRPGTYDITSWRYDERPELFIGQSGRSAPVAAEPYAPRPGQRTAIAALLGEFGYAMEPEAFLGYIADAVRLREEAKFAFTRSISETLSILVHWGATLGLDRDDLSFLTIGEILDGRDGAALSERIAHQREAYEVTRAIRLPHLICETKDIDVVRLPLGHPTFITGQSVTAPARRLDMEGGQPIDGCIVLIESADPGFDWIFSHAITGLVTKYGGANSHMAVRCAEFGLPAAIGCGERLYGALAGAAVIELNAAARRITGH
jgi:glutamine kinase